MPCHAQVAAAERLLVPARIDASSLPLTIGPLTQAAEHADDVLALLLQPSAKREGYVLAYRPAPPRWTPPWLRKRRGGTAGLRGCARLALQAGATSGDIVQALLQVCWIYEVRPLDALTLPRRTGCAPASDAVPRGPACV